MNFRLTSILYFFLLLTACGQQAQTSALTFQRLLCNGTENARYLDDLSPSFSWVVDATGNDKHQSAYQIQLATTAQQLKQAQPDLWDSQKVESSVSTYVPYRGDSLAPTQIYYWRVKIWDEAGLPSAWSDVQTFTTGLVFSQNWGEAEWITLSEDTRTSPYRFRDYKTGKMRQAVPVAGFAAGYFRHEAIVTKEVEEAQAYICGLGYYELSLNGKKVGDHVLDPAPANYDKIAYYVGYDITELLGTGANAFGITLGNGFYGQNISWKRDPESDKDVAYGPPAVKLLVKLKYKDGSRENIYTDDNWKETTGPIVFNNIYGGDTYDARYEVEGWNTVGFDDRQLKNASVTTPIVGKLTAQQIPPIRKLREFAPERVFQATDGDWIVDFGQNIAGWVQLNVQEKAGQLIEVITTEALLRDGSDIFPGSTGGGANGMPQLFQYVCKSDQPESWEPKFSYHGFRYAKLKGISRRPDAAMIKAVLVATDVQETGSFTSSDSLLNRMHRISKWTIVDNLHGIPEDCPHREKCGWLGDAHAFCEYALYNYDMYQFYQKYLEDIRTQRRSVSGRNDPEAMFKVPTMIAPGKRTSSIAKLDWGIATMYLPWYNYRYYGDRSIVTEYYEDMKGLTNYYLSFKGENGIIENGMGDWCPPRWDRRANPGAMECDPIVSANAYFYDVLGIMESFAKMQSDQRFATAMQQERAALKDAFNQAFLVDIPGTPHKWYESQTATVQALQFGLAPDSLTARIVAGLVYDINEIKGGHHSTGIHGNRYLYTVLTEHGRADLAYDVLTTPDFPSQAYVMNEGFTTWPERQFEWETMPGPTNSLNHPMHSGFAAFFYESLGGIKSTDTHPGYERFTVKPQFPTAITSTEVTVPTPYGDIKNSWRATADELVMKLHVPFNTSATLPLSTAQRKSLRINGKEWNQPTENQSTDSNVTLGSGNYQISYSLRIE